MRRQILACAFALSTLCAASSVGNATVSPETGACFDQLVSAIKANPKSAVRTYVSMPDFIVRVHRNRKTKWKGEQKIKSAFDSVINEILTNFKAIQASKVTALRERPLGKFTSVTCDIVRNGSHTECTVVVAPGCGAADLSVGGYWISGLVINWLIRNP